MIQEIKATNFLSFRDEIKLSFDASKDTTLEDPQVIKINDGKNTHRLLRLAIIYGANASGKTNVLQILEFLRMFWVQQQEDMGVGTDVIPFLLDTETPDQPSLFEIKFFINNTRYWYQLSLDKDKVIYEKLSFYKDGSPQPTSLFLRTFENEHSVIKFNSNVIKTSAVVAEQISLKCLNNMSFFAARKQVNCALAEIDEGYNWLRKNIAQCIEPDINMQGYVSRKLNSDANLKESVLKFIHKADFNITRIDTQEIEAPIPPEIRNYLLSKENMPSSAREALLTGNSWKHIQTHFQHTVINSRGTETYEIANNLQSTGTIRVMGLESAIYEAINKGNVLSIDEIETSLHPFLIELIIKEFLSQINNRSQLIVTTHYDPLIDEANKLMRRDCIWFTDKGEDGCTRLSNLTDKNGLNKKSSLFKAYKRKELGGTPCIKD